MRLLVGYHDKVHHLLPLLVLLALLVAYVSARSACDATVANSGRRAANEGDGVVKDVFAALNNEVTDKHLDLHERDSFVNARDKLSCDYSDGTTFNTTAGASYKIYCSCDFAAFPLASLYAGSFEDCMNLCDTRNREVGWTECVNVVWLSSDPPGGPYPNCVLRFDMRDMRTSGFSNRACAVMTKMVESVDPPEPGPPGLAPSDTGTPCPCASTLKPSGTTFAHLPLHGQ